MIEHYLNKILKQIRATEKTKENSTELLHILEHFDPNNLTKYEFSFKAKGSRISPELRFLNMDADAYSCKNSKIFLKRLQIFEKILERKCKNKNAKKVIAALEEVSKTPMDLYFGADIEDVDALNRICGAISLHAGLLSLTMVNSSRVNPTVASDPRVGRRRLTDFLGRKGRRPLRLDSIRPRDRNRRRSPVRAGAPPQPVA